AEADAGADAAAPVEAGASVAASATEAPALAAPSSALTPPEGAITARQARIQETAYVGRFKAKFERLGRVHCPLDGKGYKAGPREHTFVKKDRSSDVIELMKRLRVYDRSLLDALPLNEMREFRVQQRGLFGRGDLKVVVSALCVSPIEDLVRQRWSKRKLTAADAKRALEELELKDGVFHYVGLLSTTGWQLDGPEQIPTRRNLLACLVESRGDGAWKLHYVPDDAWGGVETVFDPETEEEKVERVRGAMTHQLRPKGEFIILQNLCEDLDVPRHLVQTALDQLLEEDPELAVMTVGGRDILKRSRL
ncbi:MAG TPA: hypothetical protein DEA08_05670, partial [Planctomycetes bacterium]|nr:hypothetical protein [Planctomycetota bacterium]